MREFLKHNLFWRNTLRSAAVHGAIVLALLIWSVASCVKRRQPREITTFVDLQVEPAAALPAQPEPESEPEPEPAPAAIPEPEPVKPKPAPKPAPKPEPKPKPKPESKVAVSRKLVRRDPAARQAPKLTPEQIRNLLAAGVKPAAAASGDPGFGWYLALVRNAMYDAWNQPSTLAGRRGLTTQITLRVQRSGIISERQLTRPSGNALMDQSAMQAAESVIRLPELPPGFGGDYKDITVDFELTE